MPHLIFCVHISSLVVPAVLSQTSRIFVPISNVFGFSVVLSSQLIFSFRQVVAFRFDRAACFMNYRASCIHQSNLKNLPGSARSSRIPLTHLARVSALWAAIHREYNTSNQFIISLGINLSLPIYSRVRIPVLSSRTSLLKLRKHSSARTVKL